MISRVNDQFKEWALGFSGCDGGNLNGKVWLCGLEYGGGDTEESLIFDDVSAPGYVGEPYGDAKDWIKFQFNCKAVKILTAMQNRDVREYKSFFQEHSCFSKNSDYFKLNLYPIGFKKTDPALWASWVANKTGFSTKQEYWIWCSENRFPVLKKWVADHSPSLIICTGITSDYEFQKAFGTSNEIVTTEEVAGKRLKYFLINNNKTLVVITYFLGTRWGLKTNEELSITGKHIAELLKNLVGKSS